MPTSSLPLYLSLGGSSPPYAYLCPRPTYAYLAYA